MNNELLEILSPPMRAIAEVLIILNDVGNEVSEVWDGAKTEIIQRIREVT